MKRVPRDLGHPRVPPAKASSPLIVVDLIGPCCAGVTQ